jgi:hypothetical protein
LFLLSRRLAFCIGRVTFVCASWLAMTQVTPAAASTPPSISQQPLNQTKYTGQTADFSVAATGTPPLAFQWHFNGAPIPAATLPTLSLLIFVRGSPLHVVQSDGAAQSLPRAFVAGPMKRASVV